MRSICKKYGWNIVKINRNHYEFSTLFENNKNKYVYFSISDVRYYKNEWYDYILIKAVKSDMDYYNGQTKYTSLKTLTIDIKKLFENDEVQCVNTNFYFRKINKKKHKVKK